MKRLILAIPLCLVALGLTPAQAAADPVTLTGGNVFYHVRRSAVRDAARRSSGDITVGAPGARLSPSWACSPCAPGDIAQHVGV